MQVNGVLAVHFYTGADGFLDDLIALIVIAGNVYLGARYGVLRRVVALAGAYLGALAATYSGNQVAQAVKGTDSNVTANAWAYVTIFAVVVLVFEALGFLWHTRLQAIAVLVLDRSIGAVLGLFVGIFEIGVLIVVAVGLSSVGAAQGRIAPSDPSAALHTVDNSLIAGSVHLIEPGIRTLAAPVLPNPDMTQHLEGSSAGNG